eukprot:scaffold68612_cov48-Phaeocystis_antarctica.AAC.1
MFVTLDVLRLSGWLNADATCRVERRAHAMRSEVRAGKVAATVQAACTERARLKAGGQSTRGAHLEHGGHVRDAGRVEAQRLVERPRVLPSRKEGVRCGARCGPGGVRAWGGGGGSGAHGEGPTQGWGARARAERTSNMLCMLVTLDVSMLSGWLNADADCRVERGAYDAGRGVGGEVGMALGGGGASGVHGKGPTQGWGPGHAQGAPRTWCSWLCRSGASGMHGEGPAEGWGPQGTRGAHVEHAAHLRDAGRVEAQRLVERHRALPSRKEGIRRGARCGPEGDRAWGGGGASGMHGEGPTRGWGGRARAAARAERTQNMLP